MELLWELQRREKERLLEAARGERRKFSFWGTMRVCFVVYLSRDGMEISIWLTEPIAT